MKKCPYCAEEIQDEAIKCKHCKEFLSAHKDRAKTCVDCGGQLREDGEFCSYCGAMQPLEDATYINLSKATYDPTTHPYKKIDKRVGKNNTKKKFINFLVAFGLLLVVLVVGRLLFLPLHEKEQGTYPESEKERGTNLSSEYFSNEELAWHAVNTYGWDCPEVVSKGEMKSGGYFWITCSKPKNSKDMNILMLRVYPREGKHPKITNKDGGYD